MVYIVERNTEYLEGKINELEINNKNKNIIAFYRNINELKEGYQALTNLEKNRREIWVQIPTLLYIEERITFFNIELFWVNDISQTEIHTAEGLVCWGWGRYWKGDNIQGYS